MMKKVMLLSMIAVLCAAVSAQAEVLYEDNFDGDGLETNTGTGGGAAINQINNTPTWVDTDGTGATYVGAGTAYQQRVLMFSENAFQSSSGFRLTVYYTTSSLNSGGHSFAWGLVSDETDLSTYNSSVANSSNPIGHIETVYSLGVNLTVWNKYTRGLNFVDGSGEPIVLDESGTNQEFILNASTPVVIEFDGDGNWSYWINGIEEASGTHPGGFDLTKSYHVVVYGQDDNGAKSVQSIMLETLGSLGAHSPTPASGDTILSNDVPTTTEVSWYSPFQDENGAPVVEPNLVSVDNFDVTLYHVLTADVTNDDPNFVGVAPVDNDLAQSFSITPVHDHTYFWRVDTTVTWDSNEITGTADGIEVIEGSSWKFVMEPSYVPPVIATYDNVITTVDILNTPITATITGNSDAIQTATFDLLEDDAEFPVGSDAVVSPETAAVPGVPTTTLTTTMAGTYKVKLVIDDGTTILEDIAEVVVYADACQAKKDAPSVWTASYYDRDGDCIVDLGDYSVLAVEWLDSTAMAAQEEYPAVVGYVPQAVYDVRTEAESFDSDDPNAFSGCEIQENEGASGGQNIGNNGGGSWVDYTINVPAAGVPVDVYIGYGLASGTRTVSFGTEVDPAAYGTAEALSTDDWYNFSGFYGGLVTFTASGPQEIRVTCPSGGLNLDWFSFDW